ncbi:MAG: hypothetical protein ABUL60_07575 [Myxococcales bacterium]
MFRALVLLTFAGAALACSPTAASSPPAVVGPRAPVATAVPEPLPVRATACRAEPSTVYGEEPVVFEIEGPAPAVQVPFQIWDERGRAILRGQTAAPGRWRPDLLSLKSGDFRLELGSRDVSCLVTVNRELARATEAAR